MTKKKTTQKYTNGSPKLVLVPDSCSMHLLATEIPTGFFVEDPSNQHYVDPKDRPKYFFDLLFDAPPKGKIKGVHILDIVNAELFGKKVDGKTFDDRFTSIHLKDQDVLKVLSYAISKSKPSCQIVETAPGRALIHAFEQFCKAEKATHEYLGYTKAEERPKLEKDIMLQIRRLKNKLGRNRGEYIIKDYLLEHPEPTLFISEDKKAREQVKKAGSENREGCIYIDNVYGLFEQLQKAGLLANMGFRETITPKIMLVEILASPRNKSATKAAFMKIEPTVISSRHNDCPDPEEHWFRR